MRCTTLPYSHLFAAVLIVMLGTHRPAAGQASITSLSDLLPGSIGGLPYAVTPDGRFVVGYATYPDGRAEAFRWSTQTGMMLLGYLPGGFDPNYASFQWSEALGISADGSLVVGSSDDEAYRWTSDGGMQGLGYLPTGEPISYASGVSADGSVVVGTTDNFSFLWTTGAGMTSFGAGNVHGISADGTVVFGTSNAWPAASRWVNGIHEFLEPLGFLVPHPFGSSPVFPPYRTEGHANGASSNGSVIVGWCDSNHPRAYRWTQAGGTELLPPLPVSVPFGAFRGAFARGVSADGSLVVGECLFGGACVWDQSGAVRSLAAILSDDCGVDVSAWTLWDAQAISADGKTIVGRGTRNPGSCCQHEMFVVRLGNTTIGNEISADVNGGTSVAGGGAITFAAVVLGGETTLSSSETAPALPTGFQLGDPATFYDISTTASFTGAAQVCLNYTGITYSDESTLKLLHYENGAWADVTASLDTEANIICGSVTSFSPFAIVEIDSDTDDDGIANDDDPCPNSNQSPTIIVNGEDTGVVNDLLPSGCTLVDLVTALLATNPSTNQVVQFLVQLKGQGVISGQELGAILQALNGP